MVMVKAAGTSPALGNSGSRIPPITTVVCKPCTDFLCNGKPAIHDYPACDPDKPGECVAAQAAQLQQQQQGGPGSQPPIDLMQLVQLAMELHDTCGIEVDRELTDSLIDAFEKLELISKIATDRLREIRKCLADQCEGDGVTRRIRGDRRQAKVTLSNVYWDQPTLKRVFEQFPDLRDQCLRVDSVGVKAREFNKIKVTAGPERFEEFRDQIAKAELGRIGVPSVHIEK